METGAESSRAITETLITAFALRLVFAHQVLVGTWQSLSVAETNSRFGPRNTTRASTARAVSASPFHLNSGTTELCAVDGGFKEASASVVAIASAVSTARVGACGVGKAHESGEREEEFHRYVCE